MTIPTNSRPRPDTDPIVVPVTRVEIADHVAAAFSAGPLSRSDLLAAAVRAGARPPLVEILRRLPDRRFNQPADLWGALPEVPDEH